MLAQLAVLDPASFQKVVELASQAGKWDKGDPRNKLSNFWTRRVWELLIVNC
jgi:hypothetical protein